mgnify:CR=1 FL=1
MKVSNNKHGWYYDNDLKNPITCCSLHPNACRYTYTTYDTETQRTIEGDQKIYGPEWMSIPERDLLLDEREHNNVYSSPSRANYGYSKYPICRSILAEDFNVTIVNEWTDFGGDIFGNVWNEFKPLAPFANKIVNTLSDMEEAQNNMTPEENDLVDSHYSSSFLKQLTVDLKNAGEDIQDYLNRSLVVQGARFSYYNGTGLEFSNLGMRFTIFPEWRKEGDRWVFKSVIDQVEEIYPYVVGEFRNISEDYTETSNKFGKLEDLTVDTFKNATGIDISKGISNVKELISWQLPPGGFKADVRNVDSTQFGTLLLRLGPFYELRNLVISNASFSYSKQMVKNPVLYGKNLSNTSRSAISGVGGGDVLFSPLYCDVNLVLKPATKYSDVSLKKFAAGAGRTYDKVITHDTMLGKLANIENSYKTGLYKPPTPKKSKDKTSKDKNKETNLAAIGVGGGIGAGTGAAGIGVGGLTNKDKG